MRDLERLLVLLCLNKLMMGIREESELSECSVDKLCKAPLDDGGKCFPGGPWSLARLEGAAAVFLLPKLYESTGHLLSSLSVFLRICRALTP